MLTVILTTNRSIVAVHGLGGDAFSTGRDKDSGSLWLRDFLPHSALLKNARIMTFGYDAAISQNRFPRNLQDESSPLHKLCFLTFPIIAMTT
jgi:hypothetical protein